MAVLRGDDQLAFAPALELARLVGRGELRSSELVELYLRRCEEIDGDLGAFVTVAAERAMEQARAADARLGSAGLPPFHGIPIAIKDLNETAGIRTTHGSALFGSHVPEADDRTVARLKQAGFIVIGKTTTPELGFSFVSEPPASPPARNPWDPSRTPGGSSGGAAAAVAAGLAPIAQGSDAGGSIRLPATRCGLFGLKPSRGRVSAAPHSDQLNWQNGPITRTVADAAAMLDAMAGYEAGDAWSAPPPARPFLTEVGAPPGRLRVAVSTGGAEDLYPGTRRALEAAAQTLAALGHEVDLADPLPPWAVVPARAAVAEGMGYTGVEISRYPGLPPVDDIDLGVLDPFVRECLERARAVTALQYVARLEAMFIRARAFVALWERFDVLLTPVVTGPALEIGAGRDGSPVDLFILWWSNSPFLGTWNLTGQPAAAVPIGLDDLGLPVGVQLVGPPAGEALLLRLCAQFEAARPWAERRPPLVVARPTGA